MCCYDLTIFGFRIYSTESSDGDYEEDSEQEESEEHEGDGRIMS